jgi:ElaB/YqjD/DUF883 family membrane-anchored ribosome-binding protein
MKLLPKTTQWRTVVVSLLMVVLVNLTSVPRVQAGDCSGWDILSLGITCVAKKIIKSGTKSAVVDLAQNMRPDFNRMVDDAGQKLVKHINSVNWSNIGQELGKGASEEVLSTLNSINWEQYGHQIGAGIRSEFEAAMDKLFDEKLKPLLTDIDNLLAQRIAQADKAVEARLQQLDGLIDDKIEKVDILIQNTFDQFQAAADETIAKVRTDIINYAFESFAAERDKTVAQIRAEVIDYAATTVNTTTAEIVAKVKAELIDQTFAQFDQLRTQFRQDVEHFFNRAENLIFLLDCTEEKLRIDLDKVREDLDKLGEKYLKEFKALTPGAQISNLFSRGESPSTKPTGSMTTNENCYQQLGLIEAALEGFEYSTIYDIKKCKVLNTLTLETPIRRIQNVYWDLHMFAKRVGCIQHNPTHFMWDWMEFESFYRFWSGYRY